MNWQPSLSLRHLVLSAGAECFPETDGLVMVRIRSGAGYLLGVEPRLELQSSETVVFGKAAGMSFRASQLAPLEIDFFLLRPHHLSGLLTAPERSFLLNMASKLARQPYTLGADHPFSVQFRELLKIRAANKFSMRCRMLQIISTLFDKEMPESEGLSEPEDAGKRLELLVKDLSESDWHELRLPDLAKACGCSHRHFSRLFRAHFGASFRTHQLRKRLSNAGRLLQMSDTKVITVALESGFRSMGLFNTMFKKHFRMTPTEWRRHATTNGRRGQPAPTAKINNRLISRSFPRPDPGSSAGLDS